MNIKYYLNKIDLSEPVNASAFKKVLISVGISIEEIHSGIEFRSSLRPKLSYVSFLCPSTKKKLIEISLSQGTSSRALAAKQNRSHDTNVEGSFILARQGIKHPVVITFDSEGSYSSGPNEPYALIIENRMNFLSIGATSKFLESECGISIGNGFDVIFGAGNEVSNSLHKRYLSNYQKIFMLFDFDAGGLQIAASIATLTPNTSHIFLIPQNLVSQLESVAITANEDTLSKVYSLGAKHEFLYSAAKIIVEQKKTIEQESYLV